LAYDSHGRHLAAKQRLHGKPVMPTAATGFRAGAASRRRWRAVDHYAKADRIIRRRRNGDRTHAIRGEHVWRWTALAPNRCATSAGRQPTPRGGWGAFASAVTGAAKQIGRKTVLSALRRRARSTGLGDYKKVLEGRQDFRGIQEHHPKQPDARLPEATCSELESMMEIESAFKWRAGCNHQHVRIDNNTHKGNTMQDKNEMRDGKDQLMPAPRWLLGLPLPLILLAWLSRRLHELVNHRAGRVFPVPRASRFRIARFPRN